jgi:hypothetical protein
MTLLLTSLLLLAVCLLRESDGFTTTISSASTTLQRRPYFSSVGGGVPTTTATPTSTRLFVKQQQQQQQQQSDASASSFLLVSETSYITPEGFGFSSPARRILQESGRGLGYHRAAGSDTVMNVMDAITSASTAGGAADVALVFDDDDSEKLLGIFTETDYITVRLVDRWVSLLKNLFGSYDAYLFFVVIAY